jgi:hypothetical protein
MLGFAPIGYAPPGGPYTAQVQAVAPVIDATKVPPERRVYFEGSKRVVIFEGSKRKVIF